MKVLLVGAGGVGSRGGRHRRAPRLLRADGGGRLRPGSGRAGDRRHCADARFVAAQVDASSADGRRRSVPRARITHVLNAIDPRFVMPIFDGRVRGRRRLPRHGDVAVASRTPSRRTSRPA